jgi:FKBP-type peptidyl-prolyl cis-trans isomerase FkpA
MNKINVYCTICLFATLFFSCSKNKTDDFTPVPLRDFQVQYEADSTAITKFLKEHSITETEVNGETEIEFIETNDINKSLFKDPRLKSFTTTNDLRSSLRTDSEIDDKVNYKVYYLILNEGEGASPTTIDSTFTAYKGQTLDKKTFDINNNYTWSSYPNVENVTSSISGYRQFTSLLKAANKNSDGSFGKSGSGVVFIPSGLAYYNRSETNIPEYSPLIFRIRLKTFKERDHDLDGILSKEEYNFAASNPFSQDTDGDKIPDFFDGDDDGDGTTTKKEVIRNADGAITKPDCNNNGIPDYLDKNNCN